MTGHGNASNTGTRIPCRQESQQQHRQKQEQCSDGSKRYACHALDDVIGTAPSVYGLQEKNIDTEGSVHQTDGHAVAGVEESYRNWVTAAFDG